MGQQLSFIITDQHHDASTLAQQWGGTVLVLSSTSLGNGDYSAKSNGQSLTSNTNNADNVEIYTLCISSIVDSEFCTYADSGLEDALQQTGILYTRDCLPPGTYALLLPRPMCSQDEVMSYVKDVLNWQGHYAKVISSGDRV